MATKTKIELQVPQGNFDVDAITERAYKDCVKKCPKEVKDFKVYIKPEENKAFYVANKDSFTGNITL